jgi:hypothetical protein
MNQWTHWVIRDEGRSWGDMAMYPSFTFSYQESDQEGWLNVGHPILFQRTDIYKFDNTVCMTPEQCEAALAKLYRTWPVHNPPRSARCGDIKYNDLFDAKYCMLGLKKKYPLHRSSSMAYLVWMMPVKVATNMKKYKLEMNYEHSLERFPPLVVPVQNPFGQPEEELATSADMRSAMTAAMSPVAKTKQQRGGSLRKELGSAPLESDTLTANADSRYRRLRHQFIS